MFRHIQHRVTPFWMLQLCGWGAFGFSMFLATAQALPLRSAAIEKGVFTLLGILFTLPLQAIYRRLYRRNIAFPKIIALSAACAYVSAMLWTICFHISVGLIRNRGHAEMFAGGKWTILFDGGLYHAFVMLAWSALYFGIKHYRDLQAQKERTLKAEALAHRANLQALRYQINPHFLFNTLNAISTLVAQQENAAANRMISRLSEFLRLTLNSSAEHEVPLSDEIDFVKRYLEIERVRLAQRLYVEFFVEPETLTASVPNLILQPLVENAIRHSIAPREEGGRLEIEAKRKEGMLHLEVRDDGPNSAADIALLNQGVGLSNTRARLEQMYGASHRFEIKRTAGFAVVIELPFDEISTDEVDQAEVIRLGAI